MGPSPMITKRRLGSLPTARPAACSKTSTPFSHVKRQAVPTTKLPLSAASPTKPGRHCGLPLPLPGYVTQAVQCRWR